MRYECVQKPSVCPECQAEQIGTLLYGLPVFSPELESDIESGKVILAGHAVTEDAPHWQCHVCGVKIFRKKSGREGEVTSRKHNGMRSGTA